MGDTAERDLYEVLGLILKDKADDILKAAGRPNGFETLRQLIRLHDPDNPILKVSYNSNIMGLIEKKCNNFEEV